MTIIRLRQDLPRQCGKGGLVFGHERLPGMAIRDAQRIQDIALLIYDRSTGLRSRSGRQRQMGCRRTDHVLRRRARQRSLSDRSPRIHQVQSSVGTCPACRAMMPQRVGYRQSPHVFRTSLRSAFHALWLLFDLTEPRPLDLTARTPKRHRCHGLRYGNTVQR